MRSGDQTDGALGIISPAVRISVLVADMMHARDLVFQTRAITLVDDRRRHKNKQVAFVTFIVMALECVANYWNIAEQWHFGSRLRNLIRNQAAECQRVATLDENIEIERTLINDRTGDIRAVKREVEIVHLVADLRLH